jgi:hypothetical protein
MAQLVVAAAGAAVGFMVGGPMGAKIGWVAGTMIGSAFAPTQKSQGPRLDDLKVSTSSYGTPIPYIAGHPRVSGQIVWASTKREISTTESAGKGGGGSEYTSYTYEVDLLLLLSDNVIPGVARVWNNGELVFDGEVKDNLWSRMTAYTGAASQFPDPDYEAVVGTANAPAYRGRGSVFIKSLQLGGSGQIPNLTFEIGSAMSSDVLLYLPGGDLLDHSSYERTVTFVQSVGTYHSEIGQATSSQTVAGAFDGTAIEFQRQNTSYLEVDLNGWFPTTGDVSFEFRFRLTQWEPTTQYGGLDTGLFLCFEDGAGNKTYHCNVRFAYAYGPLNVYLFGYTGATLDNAWQHGVAQRISGTWYFGINGTWVSSSVSFPIENKKLKFGNFYYQTGIQVTGAISGAIEEVLVKTGITYPWTGIGNSYTVPGSATGSGYSVASADLVDVTTDICALTGLESGQFDATPLATITRPVHAMAISQVSSARTVLEMLAAAYYFDCVLSDKLYFRPRASASVATLTFDELGVAVDSNSDADPLPLMMANELEIPAQMAITYSNIDGDYQTDTQYSDRLLTGQESTSATTLPLGFTASEGKQIADALLLDKAVSALSTVVSVGITRAELEPTDVVILTGDDGFSYRMRITKKTEAAGVITLGCVADDAAVFTQAGVTDGGTTSQTEVLTTPTTVLELLDIPLLSDSNNSPGHYVAVKGENASWKNAALFESADNVTYVQNQVISGAAVMGTCTTTLGNWTGGNFADETNTLTVDVGYGELSSVTHEAMLSNQSTNAALVGDEIIQFREATLVSSGVYTLKGLLRGKRGTEWAMSSHAASERFVRLSSAGVRYVTQITSDIGKLIYFKAVSAGMALSSATAESLTLAGNSLRPLAPVNLRVSNEADGSLLKWDRRTRLAENWLSGVMPLGESAESYIVKIYSGSTLKRTLTASTAQANYTRTMQNADAIAGDMTFTVQQISGTFGPGIAASSTGGTGYTPPAVVNTITLGGTFESGKTIRVTLNLLYVNYTTTVGDATLDGVATSLAAAINAASSAYTATAVGPVVSVVQNSGWAFTFGAKMVMAANLSMQSRQAPTAAEPGSADVMWCVIAPPGGSGEIAGQPIGTVFELTVRSSIYDAVPIRRTYSYTLPSYTADAQAMMLSVYQGLVSAFDASGDAAVYGINMLVNFYGTASGIEFTGQFGIPGWFCYITSPNSDLSYTTSLLSPSARPAVPEDLPQVVSALVNGTVEAGMVFSITLNGTTYSYTAIAADTPLIVTTELGNLIAVNTDFIVGAPVDNSLYAGGYYFLITRAVALTPFTYSASQVGSTITLTVAAVNPAP